MLRLRTSASRHSLGHAHMLEEEGFHSKEEYNIDYENFGKMHMEEDGDSIYYKETTDSLFLISSNHAEELASQLRVYKKAAL